MTEEMKQMCAGTYEGEVLSEYIEKLENEIAALQKELDVYRLNINQTLQENIKLQNNFNSAIKLHDNLLAKYEKLKEGMWIPVEECLPHFLPYKQRKVLVTLEDKKRERFVTIAKYDEILGQWRDFPDYRYENFRVVAWMHKPEPYDSGYWSIRFDNKDIPEF